MIDAVNQSGPATAALAAQQSHAGRPLKGVRPLPNLRQLLSDLAEEMSFSVAESQDYEETDAELIERGEDVRRDILRQKVEELQDKYLDAYDGAEEHFRAELKRREGQTGASGGGELEAWLESPSEDASLNGVLLQRAEADGSLARALGGPERARNFLDGWLARHDNALHAGLNSLPSAHSASRDLGASLERVQHFYQSQVSQFHSVVGLLASVAEQFGLAQFGRAKNFIAQALAADFAAARPSQDKVRLHNILQELQGIKSLNTIRWKLDAVAARFAGPEPLPKEHLLDCFVQYLHAPSDHAPALLALPAQASGEQKVLFLQGLAGAVRALPPDLFADADARPRALAALQQPIDRLILEEGY